MPLHLTHWAFKRQRNCQFVTLSAICLLVEHLNLIERRKHVNNSHTQYWKSGVMWILSLYKFSLQQHLDKHRQLGFVRLSIYRTIKNLSIGVAKSRLTSSISDYRHGLNNHLSKQHIWLFGVWRLDCLEGDFRLQHASNKVRLSETHLQAAVRVWRMWCSFFPQLGVLTTANQWKKWLTLRNHIDIIMFDVA